MLSRQEKQELVRLEKQQRIRKARTSYLDFITYTKPDYEVNWHHGLTARYLQDFVIGNIRRLMIFEPPRHGKSEQTSRRLPPYILGKFPDKQVIFSTYSH